MTIFFPIALLPLMLTLVIADLNCDKITTCLECIQDACVWCPAENHNESRCNTKDYALKNNNWCNGTIQEPYGEERIEKNLDFSAGTDGQDIVQFKPQFIKIKATPGYAVDITMSYKPAEDAPLDVYILLDNSYSMSPYRLRLEKQSKAIYESLMSMTNNVRLGVGSFVERPAMPYANTYFNQVYTFQNHLSLTNNTEKFRFSVSNITIGSNYDDQEAVFDGLMQSMVCEKEIGWRKDARRIIVVFTDGYYHNAGDGKAVGAFKPHDMKCHIGEDVDTVLDYPSVSQINKVAKDKSYVIIFAVTDDIKAHYELLTPVISNTKCVSLTDDVNLTEMITSEYLAVVQSVNVEHNASSYIEITKEINCTAGCKGTHFQPVNISATLKVLSCPDTSKVKEDFEIRLTSLNEPLIVEVEFDCKCKCEKDSFPELDAKKCNKFGYYQCGKCKCHKNRYGDDCGCTGDSLDNKDFEKCKKDAEEIVYCSGRGECKCGKCVRCTGNFYGDYCEFDDTSCPRPGGQLCSGNGDCKKGKCNCKQGWGKDDCGCTTSNKTCTAPYSDKPCSGNGKCECGQCVCDPVENPDDKCRGRFCDDCKSVTEKRCNELQHYAYCMYLKKTNCSDVYNETDSRAIFVNRSEIQSPNREWYVAQWCRIDKEDDSIFVFKYYYLPPTDSNDAKLVLVIQNELEKPAPVNIWVAVGSSLGAIVLIGLLSLLLWKVLTDMYDKREYNQFKQKAQAAGYDVTLNPWYEPPVVSFVNLLHADHNSQQSQHL